MGKEPLVPGRVLQVGAGRRVRADWALGKRDTRKVWGDARKVQGENYASENECVHVARVSRVHNAVYAEED